MNAVFADPRTPLELPSTREFPRRLEVRCDLQYRRCRWTVGMYAPRGLAHHQLAWITASDARLTLQDAPRIWIGDASFELSADEAKQVRETFEPHGLKVEESK